MKTRFCDATETYKRQIQKDSIMYISYRVHKLLFLFPSFFSRDFSKHPFFAGNTGNTGNSQ